MTSPQVMNGHICLPAGLSHSRARSRAREYSAEIHCPPPKMDGAEAWDGGVTFAVVSAVQPERVGGQPEGLEAVGIISEAK